LDENFRFINCLEYITNIIKYCTALKSFASNKVNNDPHPAVLCITDNTSTLNWMLHTSKKMAIGQALVRIFCGLLIGSDVGINAKWISTVKNVIADRILRLKATHTESTNSPSYDYSNLKQDHKELKACSFFQLSYKLLSFLWEILLTKKMSRFKSDSEIETTQFRQAAYINWMKSHCIPNPYGPKLGYECIVACFIKQLMLDQNSCPPTVQGYVESINTLFWLWDLPIPANLSS
jgi:hypothetical protein